MKVVTRVSFVVTRKMDIDRVLTEVIGEFGRSQKRLFILVNVLCFSASCQLLILVFTAASPQWTCPNSSTPSRVCDSSIEGCCDKDGSVCVGAVFASNFTSIATEWGLLCSQSYKNELVQSFFMAGSMVGGPVFGGLADKYGRKSVWVGTFTACAIVSSLSAFATSYNVFLVLRCVVGFLVGGFGLVSFVYSTESIGPAQRGFIGTVQSIFFSVTISLLGLLAYLIRDWRMLTLATMIPSAFGPFCFYMFPESPRWLASQGRTDEAEAILQQMAKENGSRHQGAIALKRVTHSNNSSHSQGTSHGISDLFSHRSLCMITVIMIITWFVNSLVYYGLSLNVKNLGGNIYVNFIFAGLIEIPSYAFTGVMISYSGRRKSLFYFMMGAMVACYACMKFQEKDSSTWPLSAAAMAGKFCISASFAIVYVYAAELFPTVIRSVGMGTASIAARVGGIVSPFVVLLGEQSRSLPMFVFAITAGVAGVLGLKLPETKRRPMPETIEDVDKCTLDVETEGNPQE